MNTRSKRIAALCVAGVLLLAALWIAPASRTAERTKFASLTIDGRTGTYLLHVPATYDATRKIPLVLVLHGAMQSPEGAERMSGMSELADKENFLVAYPSGTGRLSRVPTWNSGNCCGYALKNQVDDVAFIRALIDTLGRDYSVDPRRVYVTGISNGAMMSYRLACELADKIAAIAPVEGAQNLECRPSNPVSVIIFHGTADRLVPFNGGSTPYQLAGHRNDTPVMDAVAFWVKADGCTSAPQRAETPEVHTTIYSGCANGTGVALYAIQGGRHMWPGHPLSGNNVRATDLMWSFFIQHPKR
ncbi:MAG: PHB depolymerase family esterase [Candidatus Acidiferrales bacterium]